MEKPRWLSRTYKVKEKTGFTKFILTAINYTSIKRYQLYIYQLYIYQILVELQKV